MSKCRRNDIQDDERWRGTLQVYDGIYRGIYPISSYISES